MKLVNVKETFEKTYTEGTDEPKPIFMLRKLSFGEVANINNGKSILDESNRLIFMSGDNAKQKITLSVVGWKNITDDSGKELPCTDSNKELLPPRVAMWLVGEIDKLNNLSGVPESERKNS